MSVITSNFQPCFKPGSASNKAQPITSRHPAPERLAPTTSCPHHSARAPARLMFVLSPLHLPDDRPASLSHVASDLGPGTRACQAKVAVRRTCEWWACRAANGVATAMQRRQTDGCFSDPGGPVPRVSCPRQGKTSDCRRSAPTLTFESTCGLWLCATSDVCVRVL